MSAAGAARPWGSAGGGGAGWDWQDSVVGGRPGCGRRRGLQGAASAWRGVGARVRVRSGAPTGRAGSGGSIGGGEVPALGWAAWRGRTAIGARWRGGGRGYGWANQPRPP